MITIGINACLIRYYPDPFTLKKSLTFVFVESIDTRDDVRRMLPEATTTE